MNDDSKLRYARIIAVPEIGAAGMAKLAKGRVGIIGAGALGSLCAMYLAAAGVGEITIADFDTIDISNLQRQLFFETGQAGYFKIEIISSRIIKLNPNCKVHVHKEIITPANINRIFKDLDFIVDATDNPRSKSMTDDYCYSSGTPYCIGGVSEFRGQVMSWQPGCARYSEIFDPQQTCTGFTPCSAGGVIGPVAGVIASMQASETIKHLTGAGEMLFNKIFIIDLLSNSSSTLEVG